MSKKTLNKTNLTALGADALAELLLDVTKGNAAQQRRLRMELSASAGTADVAGDIRKRCATLRRSTGYVSWRKKGAFARELSDLIGLIRTRVAPDDPGEAFDLLWSFLQLAPSIYERCDDSSGTIGSVMSDAMEHVSDLAPMLTTDCRALAERVFEALQDNGYGEFDGAIPALAEALGSDGLARLKDLAQAVEAEPLSEADLARYDFVDDPEHQRELAQEARNRSACMILQAAADLEGDVDAYMARYSAKQLTFHTIAPDVAARLLAAGRANEALQIVEGALTQDRRTVFDTPELTQVRVECLDALDRGDSASEVLWEEFCQTLRVDCLRQYLRRLPDFEDIEAGDRAKSVALAHPDIMMALTFFLEWPDMRSAASLIEIRFAELDGNAYYILNPAAAALDGDYPLAATLARRALILDTLDNKRSKRYGHAATHLAECDASDGQINDYQTHLPHAKFLETLRYAHPRKSAFWSRV
ncbi:DUF6880 family protein [Sedimentitalea sp.]|uniref:DUF6880 family protein n=1 Tax=Sedimentitalea sp. TaxID=2048915 RepID=UPI00329957A1